MLGAAYLCHGLEPTRELITRLVGPTLSAAATLGAGLDWKTSVQEVAAERGLGVPHYQVQAAGPDHERHFTAHLVLGEKVWGSGEGSAKKVAEARAAEAAYHALAAEAAQELPGPAAEADPRVP